MSNHYSAFFDATCRKCRAHIGWHGKAEDHPMCPRCGTEPDKQRLADDVAKIDDFRELLADLRSGNTVKWQKARLSAGLTLRQAAKELAISPTELSAIERGEQVPEESLQTKMRAVYLGDVS